MKEAWDNDEERKKAQSERMSEKNKDEKFHKKMKDINQRTRTEEERENMKKAQKKNFEEKSYIKEKIGDSSKERWNDENYRKFMKDIQKAVIDDECIGMIRMETIRNNFPSQKKILESLSNNERLLEHW